MASLADIAQRAAGASEALVCLHEAGASPVQAIRALRDGRGLSLAEAKAALMRSPAWAAESEAATRLHDELLEALGLDS